MKYTLLLMVLSFWMLSCNSNEVKKQNGISLSQDILEEDASEAEKLKLLKNLRTKPGKVLLTGHKSHRLLPIYRVNYNTKKKIYFTGTTNYHRNYNYDYYDDSDRRYDHYMPGIEAAYGYNMVNVAYSNLEEKEKGNLFETSVLINTLYYPSLELDSLFDKPIVRDYYLVSVYNQDTNKDSLINRKDLRRFFRFELKDQDSTILIPSNYSVMSSQYDSKLDKMYVYAKKDENENGQREEEEPIHVFAIDLRNPKLGERIY